MITRSRENAGNVLVYQTMRNYLIGLKNIMKAPIFRFAFFFLLAIIILPGPNSTALAQTATAPAIGDGSSGNPFQIATFENLYWIAALDDVAASPTQAERWSGDYIQTMSFDASATATWNSDGSRGF